MAQAETLTKIIIIHSLPVTYNLKSYLHPSKRSGRPLSKLGRPCDLLGLGSPAPTTQNNTDLFENHDIITEKE